ncbi:hypothetical protein SUDANB171_05321 [Streptomyces sp. enrichment culture]|uniref:zinc-dependent metalloprotease n=1 Tax=Streptomyces sp. enrichment culture TaxID=1795815 RepID=UPI003F576A85
MTDPIPTDPQDPTRTVPRWRLLPGRTSAELLLAIAEFDTPFLLTASLSHGLGSSALTLDRGKAGPDLLATFRHAGDRVLLLVHNKHHRAAGDTAATRAGAEGFAGSVLWSGPIVREDGPAAVVDVTTLALTDLHGIADHLRERDQGDYTVDPATSLAHPADASGGPHGIRLPALLTLRGRATGAAVRSLAPLPDTLTLVQRLELLPLPADPLPPRPYHPASGGYGVGHRDHGGPVPGAEVRLQPRFRLTEPVVFLVDPAVPEPIRSAVLEGGNWWQDAFDAAGLPGAFRVETAPEDLDLSDPAHNTVWWVHRDGRGWSHGQTLSDPRTGEILHGRVRLGSQRVAQLTALAEALLAPYGQPDEAARLAAVQDLVLRRIRHLAAHEIGHALGFMHNFASHHHPRPSVMDYPHPHLTVTPDGELDTTHAYSQGLGPWDHFLVAHAYGQTPGDELRRAAAAQGLRYLADEDANGPDAAHADAVPWTVPVADPFTALDQALEVRRTALARFSRSVLPPDRQTGELEDRALLLHLYHRHQLTAVARLVAGVRYGYAQAGDPGAAGTTPVAAADQWRALRRTADLLHPSVLTLPPAVLHTLTPPAIRYRRDPEALRGQTGRTFDPLTAAAAATALVAAELLTPARLNRLAWQHATDPALPAPADVACTLLGALAPDPATDDGVARLVRTTATAVVQRHLHALLADERTHTVVREALRPHLDAPPAHPDPEPTPLPWIPPGAPL